MSDVPGRLNRSMSPDKPASLPEPYKCAETAGESDMKQPHTNPYMMPNAICRPNVRRIQQLGEPQYEAAEGRETHDASISGDKGPDEQLCEAGEHDYNPE